MTDLEELLKRLFHGSVRFVVVGGFAAMAHGASRLTQDVDISMPFSVPNLLRLQQALGDIHPVHRMNPNGLPLQLTRSNASQFKNLYLKTDLGQLDCLSEISGIGDYAAVARLSKRYRLDWGTCRILNLDGLIRAKEAMPRRQDREVLQQLKAIRERQRKHR